MECSGHSFLGNGYSRALVLKDKGKDMDLRFCSFAGSLEEVYDTKTVIQSQSQSR
jgi:hypothetical protein